MRNLVAAIIYVAVCDWKIANKHDEIREFFRSDYGQFLCDCIDMSATIILEKLEKMEV